MIIIAILLLGSSLLISTTSSNKEVNLDQNKAVESTTQKGNINLVINPPATKGVNENG